ncbi:putative membrane protein [Turkeypox virus]|uniref:Protein OPG070 n=1 Tax=Turkeypox virus TaxID=336486 RepID=A0A0M3ZEL0_9POXV|nr:hypothetical protein ASN15_gp069 [Turkeypox virus]ALA62443.1 putative membrane protein [Turkeypox virus]
MATSQGPTTHLTLYNQSQSRSDAQSTFHRRDIPPLLKHTFVYHEYAYGWIPETLLWNSQYEKLDIRNYYPIDVGLLNKFDFMLGLYNGQVPQYVTKINIQNVERAPSVSFNDYFKKFAILPTDQLISFLLLTSIPIYNIMYFFKTTIFNPKLHSLLNYFYIDDDKHIELAKYLILGGDYPPIFNKLDQPGLYDGTLNATDMYHVMVPQGKSSQKHLISIELLINISAILTYTNQDPVIAFLIFYLPGLSVTTKITPAVQLLMDKLGLSKDNVVLV